MAFLLIGLQADDTRRSMHEGVTGANAVATQLLSGVQWAHGSGTLEGMTAFLGVVGRIRAHSIELYDDRDQLIYRSPSAIYEAGRDTLQ